MNSITETTAQGGADRPERQNPKLSVATCHSRTNLSSRCGLLVLGVGFLLASPAFAGGSGMPWEGPLQQVVDSVTGPVAQAAGVIAVTIFGLGLAFSESGSGMRRGISILFGIAIAFSAASFFMGFFGFGGGAVIG